MSAVDLQHKTIFKLRYIKICTLIRQRDASDLYCATTFHAHALCHLNEIISLNASSSHVFNLHNTFTGGKFRQAFPRESENERVTYKKEEFMTANNVMWSSAEWSFIVVNTWRWWKLLATTGDNKQGKTTITLYFYQAIRGRQWKKYVCVCVWKREYIGARMMEKRL